jgi:hypothetical protein
MGILRYAKGIWVGGKRFFKRGGAKTTDRDSGRRERARMQQLRLTLYHGEGRDVVAVLENEGNDAVFVNDRVLPAGCFLEQIATPYLHSAGLLPLPQSEHLLAAIIEGPAVFNDPPPYSIAYRPHASS